MDFAKRISVKSIKDKQRRQNTIMHIPASIQ